MIAAYEGNAPGLVDHWLEPVRYVCRQHAEELDAIVDRDDANAVADEIEASCRAWYAKRGDDPVAYDARMLLAAQANASAVVSGTVPYETGGMHV